MKCFNEAEEDFGGLDNILSDKASYLFAVYSIAKELGVKENVEDWWSNLSRRTQVRWLKYYELQEEYNKHKMKQAEKKGR